MERVAIVTGASRGLGLALAGALAERGWRLIVDARGAAELAAQRTPTKSGSRGRRGDGDTDAPAPVFEVSSVAVLPAGDEPSVSESAAEGTAADWLPGIKDEHEDSTGWQAKWLDRPTWDVTVTPNVRRRQGTRPPRRRR